MDYANNRYYSNAYGRMMTPDPSWRSVALASPQSWNRYAYMTGDPVNGNDPLGLCTAMLAGITMNPGGPNPWEQTFDNEQGTLGGIAGFPYSNQNVAQGVASVASQALFGANTSTMVAVAVLEEALSQNTGSIDVIAYSGGAQAFTTAFNELTPAQQARIGNILYISPGAGGQLAGTAIATNTSVVTGAGVADIAATAGMTIPLGANQIQTNCDHTDLGCLLNAAQTQLAQFAKDGPCTNQDIFSRPVSGPGGGPHVLFFQVADVGGGGSFGSGSNPGGAPVPDPVPVVTSTITYNQ